MKIVLTPEFFLGKDILIEGFSFIILLIFFILALKNYKIGKNKKMLYLGIGFGLIALAQLASVFTKTILYYDIGPSQAIGQAIITSQIVNSVDIFYYIGFFFHRFLTLLGFFLIYRLPKKKINKEDSFLILFFLFLSAFIGKEFYYFFHLTCLMILIFITNNYLEIYKKNKLVNTKILIFTFIILSLAQLIYIFSKLGDLFVVANITELIGYILLVFLFIKIIKNGKKKEQDGNNIKNIIHSSRKKNWN